MFQSQQPTFQVCIESLPPQHVACYRSVSRAPEEDGTQYIRLWISQLKLPDPVRYFGFDIEVTPDQQKAGLRGYEFWIVIPPSLPLMEALTHKDFPGGRYAVATLHRALEDPYNRIPAGWKKLHEWVIESDLYRSASHQWLEEVIHHEDGDDLKLYHPVIEITH